MCFARECLASLGVGSRLRRLVGLGGFAASVGRGPPARVGDGFALARI